MSEKRVKAKHRSKKNSVREMPEEDPDFQIAPMIDVLLVLLVFFMSISSTEVLQSTKSIELPIAAEASATGKNKGQVIVNVAWLMANDSGTVTIDERVYGFPELTAMLTERKAANKDIRVLVRADKDTRFEYLRAVMLAVAQSQIANITFSVVDKAKAGSPAAAGGEGAAP